MTEAFVIVTTSVGTRDDGKAIARALVEQRLAACVQITPIESVYRWGGSVEEAEEHLLICKIRASDYPAVEAAIRAGHTYDVPEIVAVPITHGAEGLCRLARGGDRTLSCEGPARRERNARLGQIPPRLT